jgi:hypothetical protein
MADKKGWEAREADLQAKQKDKKDEEIAASEKEDLENTRKKIEELTSNYNFNPGNLCGRKQEGKSAYRPCSAFEWYVEG